MADAITTTSPNVSQPRSNTTIAVDNLLRKVLRVSDPRDPDQIANALLSRYPQEADNDRREREGYAYSSVVDAPAVVNGGGPSSIELAQAQDDLDRDLQTLATASELKDIRVEMIGWGRAIRQVAANGISAARLALDPVQQDRAMSARRSLGEYARIARYVGALTEGSGLHFRRFAQSCDLLAGAIVVAIGDGLASNGITRSTALVRVAASELQARRNAVIVALRTLMGSVEASLGQEDWPRGIEAYRNLVRQLETAGQSDLRALLDEAALGQAMDDLVDLSTGASIDSLRELQTTAAIIIHRFQRLIQFGHSFEVPIPTPIQHGPPESPPLMTFNASLQLFVDAFDYRASSRLLYVARPAIMAYGLYGVGGPDAGGEILRQITVHRSLIMSQIECLGGCGCDLDDVTLQLLGDYVVGLLDQSINLYAVGTNPDAAGEVECRAALAAVIIDVLMSWDPPVGDIGPDNDLNTAGTTVADELDDVGRLLARALGPPRGAWSPGVRNLIIHELRTAYQSELQIERVVRSLAPGCNPQLFNVDDARDPAGNYYSLIRALLRDTLALLGEPNPLLGYPVQIPSPIASSMASFGQNRPDFWSTRP